MQLCNNGHCCIPEMALVDKTAKILQVNNQIIFTILKERIDNGSLNTEVVGGETFNLSAISLLCRKKKLLCVYFNYNKQLSLYRKIIFLYLSKYGKKTIKSNLHKNKKEAIKACLHHGVLVLTGGPGTGKTTVIKGILSILKAQGLKIRLAAPTGRAAKRLSETTGQKALTIHRLLEANNLAQDDNLQLGFSKDIDDQLDADVIILDEVSMVDIVLMHHFLNAVPDGCRIILVGDTDQLPAVGPGSVLKDIIRSQKIPAIRLDEIFRQAQTSMIIQNAHIINAGRLPDLRKQYSDFVFYELNDDTSITQKNP